MKTSDYVTVGFIAVFVTIISYFAVNSFLGDPKELSVKFEYLNTTSTQLAAPNTDIFNAGAINPTVEVYVGSCVDQDQNGILSEEEKIACGQDAMRTNTGQTESDYLQENNGLSNDENDTINANEGYANGTTAQQREAVENDVNQYRENQGNTNTQNAAENAARQETVSGS
ncbi:hypothetical protein IK146_02445 [Candidatus Saccharibacteria bacterium]|nr:hypothetical protein [Candidatus Saccharibacteria bacterium]